MSLEITEEVMARQSPEAQAVIRLLLAELQKLRAELVEVKGEFAAAKAELAAAKKLRGTRRYRPAASIRTPSRRRPNGRKRRRRRNAAASQDTRSTSGP
jgi:hypothetical protein